jgi:subtilisin family serine protease
MGRDGRGIAIAVIDSGVHADHPHINGVAGGIAIDRQGQLSSDYVDHIGHGTAVTAAIKEKAPAADLYVIRIFDERLSATLPALIAAIRWAVSARVHIINLSLGTTNPAHAARLRDAAREAREHGVTIVAARDDDGIAWLPGSLPGVIPVQLDWTCPRHEFRVVRDGDDHVFRASGFARPIPGIDPRRNLNGISFAVANITGFLACALSVGDERSSDPALTLAAGAPASSQASADTPAAETVV